MVAKSSSLKTRILPRRRLSGVSVVNGVYAPKEKACLSGGKGCLWDSQRIEPERKTCPQSLRLGPLYYCLSRLPRHPEGAIYPHFTDEETAGHAASSWRQAFGCSFFWLQSLGPSSLIPPASRSPSHGDPPPHPQMAVLCPCSRYYSRSPWASLAVGAAVVTRALCFLPGAWAPAPAR